MWQEVLLEWIYGERVIKQWGKWTKRYFLYTSLCWVLITLWWSLDGRGFDFHCNPLSPFSFFLPQLWPIPAHCDHSAKISVLIGPNANVYRESSEQTSRLLSEVLLITFSIPTSQNRNNFLLFHHTKCPYFCFVGFKPYHVSFLIYQWDCKFVQNWRHFVL